MIDESNIKTETPAVYEDKQIYDISVDDLLEDQEQPRKLFDKKALDALKQSIKKYGLVQPIAFRQRDKDNRLIVVAGERRVRAIKSIVREARKHPEDKDSQAMLEQFETIKGVFISDEHKALSIIENVQRENLNPVELAEGLAKLKDEENYGLDHLGTMIGKSMSTVSEVLSINKLPDEIRDEAKKRNDVSQWVMIEVAKSRGAKNQHKKWEKLKDSGLTQAAYRKEKKAAVMQGQDKGFDLKMNLRFIKMASSQLEKLEQLELDKIKKEERDALQAELDVLEQKVNEVYNKLLGPK